MIRRRAQDDFGWSKRGDQHPTNFGHLSRIAATSPGLPPECGRHPLADRASSLALHHRVQEITGAFDAIEPVLRGLAPRQFEDGFARRAAADVLAKLHLDFTIDLFAADWTAPLNMGALYARCVLGTFCRLIEQRFDRCFAHLGDCGSIEDLVQRWGLHAIDLTPCSDSRLVDVISYILRIPPSLVTHRKSSSRALFSVEETVRHWERAELRRWRNADPNKPSDGTRYLKLCIYPFDNARPADQACVAQDGDDDQIVHASLARLRQLGQAVRLLHGEGASVATLLVGVNTRTEAIRVHVPDVHGTMHAGRHLNSHILYNGTSALSLNAAKEAIHNAVATCAGVSVSDVASAGMRALCSYLLEANIVQLDYRREWHWLHSGSNERLIVVGDPVDETPMSDFALQAQMSTFAEGAAELDRGIDHLRDFHAKRRLATPLLVHVRVDPVMPEAMQCARDRASNLATEIRHRYSHLVSRGYLHIQAVIRDSDGALLPFELDQPSVA